MNGVWCRDAELLTNCLLNNDCFFKFYIISCHQIELFSRASRVVYGNICDVRTEPEPVDSGSTGAQRATTRRSGDQSDDDSPVSFNSMC